MECVRQPGQVIPEDCHAPSRSVRTKMHGSDRRSSHVHQSPMTSEEIAAKFETEATRFRIFRTFPRTSSVRGKGGSGWE